MDWGRTLFSRQDRTVSLLSTQEFSLTEQGLHKIKPVNIVASMEKGYMSSNPLLNSCWQSMAAIRESQLPLGTWPLAD